MKNPDQCQSNLRVLGTYLGHPLDHDFISGGERHFIEVYKRCKDFGYKVHVLTTSTGVAVLRKSGFNAVQYVIPSYFKSVLYKSLALSFAVRTFQSIFHSLRLQESFDLVCSSSHFLFDVLPAVIVSRKNEKSKLVVYLHHLEPPPFKRARYHPLLPNILTWISQSLSLRLVKNYASLIFINPLDEAQITRLGIPREKVRIMRQGIDTQRILNVKKSNTEYSACFLGRLAPFKGIFDLIDIWKSVCVTFPDAYLVIIGSEIRKYVDQFQRKIEQNGMEKNIVLLGVLQEDKKYAILKACKVFLFPSHEEGLGIVIFEALACGVPVIAYDLPAYHNFEDAIVRVPVGNKKVFSETVLKFLSDEMLRAGMRRNAKRVIDPLDWNGIAEKEMSVLNHEIMQH